MIQFSDKDLEQLKDKGISQETVEKQIATFQEGIPFVHLERAAIVDNGIHKFTVEREKTLIQNFESKLKSLSPLKFVPASGAASRMFKALFNFLEDYDPKKESLDDYLNRTGDTDIKKFSKGLTRFPFYGVVQGRLERKGEEATSKGEEMFSFVSEMLGENALNYGFYPKGLLPFHNYGDFVATPFEEHLVEASQYGKTQDTAQLHFTISPQHGEMFNTEFNAVKNRVGSKTKTTFEVGYSFQKPATDTIAVDMENNPFRNGDGSLLFRPGGHGALIANLNEQDADIIFIKNIDNVVVPEVLEEVSNSKKILGGILLEVQEKAFAHARSLEKDTLSQAEVLEIKNFLVEELNVRFSGDFEAWDMSKKTTVLRERINRPIRICGMVKNEGEPGGGPFWIRDGQNNVSLQIIESAQVDMSNPDQASILRNATHFNPVDLVCGVRDHSGRKYDLLRFVDSKQGFISEKTKDGKALKALELPGLWNGAMAFWNTIFVEVPLATFNPVKTVNDLLKDSHQGGGL
ncbi:MAG: DUF4301 family protein [Bacteroidota bacterium]